MTTTLKIETKSIRPPITIDGGDYELVSPDELTIVQHQMLASCGRRMERLMTRDDLTEDEQAELTGAIHNSTAMILKHVPEEVRTKLQDMHLLMILNFYAEIPLRIQGKARSRDK